MDIYDENKVQLKTIWEDERERQNAKIVIFAAIADATELTGKECEAVFMYLDTLLLDSPEDDTTRPDPAT